MASVAALVTCVAVGAWGFYDYGRYKGGYDRDRDAEKLSHVRDQLDQLEKENKRLHMQAALLQQGNTVDRYAYKDVSQSLKGLQDEIYELKEEVAFYRTVLEPGKAAKGLRIQSLKLQGVGHKNQYRYKLVLTQVLTNAKPVSGAVEVTVYGMRNGTQGTLSWSDLTSDRDRALPFQFKYFQKLEGVIAFPAGFKPTRIALRVVPKGRHNDAVEQSFKWSEVEA